MSRLLLLNKIKGGWLYMRHVRTGYVLMCGEGM